ncbi:MAG: DUF3800 domain-containing protein [Candidatus Moranbacteria bacterium]|jgi:hypothetical protein|nr:DUF3800 domain-containing protein [Candidatus Moranbacteria bacterium]
MNNLNKKQFQYKLFIDELGVANPKATQSEVYILSGCSIDDSERDNIRNWADHIKFKYWGRTDIVFHSREIGRKEGDFAMFKNQKIFKEFIADLEEFLKSSRFKMFFVIVDKNEAKKKAWDQIKIYKDTTDYMIRNFLLAMLTNDSKGKIVVESAGAEKDFYFHKALGYYLSGGIPDLRVDYKKVQETITSISFVTKNNHDIEEQIADLFAYAAKCKYFIRKKKKIKRGVYEDMIMQLLNKKIFKLPTNACNKKEKYFKEINPFLILPL